MRTTILYSLVSLVAATALVTTPISSVAAAERETVAYRLADWKTMHFDNAKTGNAHYDAVEKLGCEVKKENHGGHLDVSYRCPEWKQMNVASHSKAHQWEKWLKTAGFETKHAH